MLAVLAQLMRREQEHAERMQPGSYQALNCPSDVFREQTPVAVCGRELWEAVSKDSEEKVVHKWARVPLGDRDPGRRGADCLDGSDTPLHMRKRANANTMRQWRNKFGFLPFFQQRDLIVTRTLDCAPGLQWLEALAAGNAPPIMEAPGRPVRFAGFGAPGPSGWGLLASSYMGEAADSQQQAAMADNTMRFNARGLSRVRAGVPQLHDLICEVQKFVGGGLVPLWADLVRQNDRSGTAFPEHRDIPIPEQGQGRTTRQRSLVSVVINVRGCGSGVAITGLQTVTFEKPGDMCAFPSELWHSSEVPVEGYGTEQGHLKFILVFGEDTQMGLSLS